MASAEGLYSQARSKIQSKVDDPTAMAASQADTSDIRSQETVIAGNQSVEPTNNAVAFIGEDVERIPTDLISRNCKTAKRLDLSYNRLKTLEGLHRFTRLEELVLDNNQLTDDSMSHLPKLPHLTTITVNKNRISDTELLLAVLSKNTPNLRYLSLLGNQACPNELLGDDHDDKDYQRYRYFVLYKIPRLTFLDSRTVTLEERKEAKRVGEFMRVIKPSSDLLQDSEKKKKAEEVHYTPLPQTADVAGQHRGVFGQCKYVYYGKHSEGNRFIRNNQL